MSRSGGASSRRWSGHARRRDTSEAYLALTVADLRLLSGSGFLEWPRRGVTISYEAPELAALAGAFSVTLAWVVTTATGSSPQKTATVRLEIRRLRFGDRWFILCPTCGARRTRVYLSVPAGDWRCRVCAQLAYRSQRCSPLARAELRVARAAHRLRERDIGNTAPARPKGMHRSVYRRVLKRLRREQDRHHETWVRETVRVLAHARVAHYVQLDAIYRRMEIQGS
jgi:hypothetical protein